MAHIGEEELAVYALSPDSLTSSRYAEIEREIAACAECRTTFEFLAVADDEDLADPDTWERVDGSPTLDSLRVQAARIAAEDAEAAELLRPLFAAPAKTAWRELRTKRYLTGGVVRKLLAHAATLHEREPLAALTFADAAILIAEKLPDKTYPAKAVYELRGNAWKEHANALRYLGRFDRALESLKRAKRAYDELASPALGLASVAFIRGTTLLEQERYEDASKAAATAEQAYSALGHPERQMAALQLRAYIAFERRDLETAIRLFSLVSEQAEVHDNAVWRARSAQGLGSACLDAGRSAEASVQFHIALRLFRTLNLRTEVTRTEWGIARLMMQGGKFDEAIRRLRAVITDFASAEMVTDAALAGLDLAEGFLSVGQMRKIVALTKHLFRVFTDAGMLTGALTAIAYLEEAAESGRLTTSDIQAVRGFLRRAERQPELLFIPPPSMAS